ncbi:MAG: UDP-glucose/GDP-mannose dehydrogenase family protein, partial [Anaerolineae bacterium]|nr:UDP-glucose/GDP-mannose dehydrogenase family protein [Anaerolineae bacterium]
SFKPNTDDMREAPSIDIIRYLISEGAHVRAYDPVAMVNAQPVLPEVTMVEDSYALAAGADALILVTEWNEFKNLDLIRIKQLMNQPVLVDGRNVYDPQVTRNAGFHYLGIGRGYDGQGL